MRVDALEAPCITLIEPVGGFTVAADAERRSLPTVENGQTARFRWTVDGETVGEAAEYLFRRHECGDYEVTFSAANDDGEGLGLVHCKSIVSGADALSRGNFPQTVYNVALGRTIRLKGWNPVNAFDAEYIWEVDGTERQRGAQLEYRFEALEEGPHEVTVTMRNSYATRSQTLSVNVCAAEGTLPTARRRREPGVDRPRLRVPARARTVGERATCTARSSPPRRWPKRAPTCNRASTSTT